MDMEVARAPAPGHDAPPAIAALDLPPHRRRDIARDGVWRIAVDAADVLRVAAGELDGLRRDLDDLAGDVLPAAIASVTDGHGDLAARSATFRRREHRVAERRHHV